MQLALTPGDWREAIEVAKLHLQRKEAFNRQNRREESHPRDYNEALRVAVDGLVVERAFQKQIVPQLLWNAYSEDTTTADIGDFFEIRSFNCIPVGDIKEHWRTLGYEMPEVVKRDIPLSFILSRGHLEIYKEDNPNRYTTFVAIKNPSSAIIVGGIWNKKAQDMPRHWAENPAYKKTQKPEDRCFWIPVYELDSPENCEWNKAA